MLPPGCPSVDYETEGKQRDAELGIETAVTIDPEVYAIHHQADKPEPDVGPILQIEVKQAEGCAQKVKKDQPVHQKDMLACMRKWAGACAEKTA